MSNVNNYLIDLHRFTIDAPAEYLSSAELLGAYVGYKRIRSICCDPDQSHLSIVFDGAAAAEYTADELIELGQVAAARNFAAWDLECVVPAPGRVTRWSV